jgi:hypothetical protein
MSKEIIENAHRKMFSLLNFSSHIKFIKISYIAIVPLNFVCCYPTMMLLKSSQFSLFIFTLIPIFFAKTLNHFFFFLSGNKNYASHIVKLHVKKLVFYFYNLLKSTLLRPGRAKKHQISQKKIYKFYIFLLYSFYLCKIFSQL